jgi:hypothetical protein
MLIAIPSGILTGYLASRPIFGVKFKMFEDVEHWNHVEYPPGNLEVDDY